MFNFEVFMLYHSKKDVWLHLGNYMRTLYLHLK